MCKIGPHEGAEEALIIMVKLIRYILKYGKDAQRNKIKGLHVLLFDFEKAFDKAWNQGLLFKIRKAGIFGITYEQIRLFLSKRFQCVRINGETSSFRKMENGVPQGGVIAPLLFLIEIDDLVSILKTIPIQFADDNSLIARAIKENLQVDELNHDCGKFESWSGAWRQPVAPTKTGYLRFTNPNYYQNFEKSWKRLGTTKKIYFCGEEIPRKQSHRVLGLTLQHDMKFNLHFEKLKSTLNYAKNMLIKYYKNDKYLTLNAKATLAKALVKSKMNYGLLMYLTPRMLSDLEIINNDIMRTTINLHKTTNLNSIRIILNWTTVEEDLIIKMITSYTRYGLKPKWVKNAGKKTHFFIEVCGPKI